MGMKGVGEACTIGACPAMKNAIVDALNREYGIRHVDMPRMPGVLWGVINSRWVGLVDMDWVQSSNKTSWEKHQMAAGAMCGRLILLICTEWRIGGLLPLADLSLYPWCTPNPVIGI